MEAIARTLHLGSKNVCEFTAHLHIVELYNVPLVEGECRVKWRFKGAIHLNSATNAVVIRDAFEGTKGRSWNVNKEAKGKERERDDSVSEPHEYDREGRIEGGTGETSGGGSSGGLASFKEAIRHPKNIIRNRRRSSITSHSRENTPDPTSDAPPAKGNATEEASPENGFSRPLLSPATFKANGDYPNNNSGSLSPTPGTRYGASPSRTSTRQGEPSYQDQASPHSYYGRHSSFDQEAIEKEKERGKLPDIPAKTESRGATNPISLFSNNCVINQHIVCAVSIPILKASGALQASPVRLSVRHKVRTTPLPALPGARYGNQVASPTKKPGPSMASVSASRGSQPSPTIEKSKEEQEEIHLGEINLDLSEFVASGLSAKATERWITRRYLLQGGKTNALLRIAVKMDWIGGERIFKA